MTSTVYQATVEELESLLSPRVVSRSLQEGLKVVGKSPETVGLEDIEKILKAQIYRQLQVALPVTEAKTRIHEILQKVKSLEAQAVKKSSGSRVLSQQTDALITLKDKLKPFNLYFEWAEVQKLRALVQLLEDELEAGRDASKIISDAKNQLRLVEQKLEDELVHQAKELGELTAIFSSVKTLGGGKVRRLEKLIDRAREAQKERQLAGGEIERARKLALDLRKLMESSVIMDDEPLSPPTITDNEGLLDVDTEGAELLSIDTDGLAPEVSAKLLELDTESERHDLDVLAKDFAVLFGYEPELEAEITELRAASEAQTSIAEILPVLRERLSAAQKAKRETLSAELTDIMSALTDLPEALDTAELRQATQVALGVLETTLPDANDVQHLRSLRNLVEQQAQDFVRQLEAEAQLEQDRLADQASALDSFNDTLMRYHDKSEFAAELKSFSNSVAKVRAAHEAQTYDGDALTVARETERLLSASIAERTQESAERERAELQALAAEFKALPKLPALTEQTAALQTALDSLVIKLEAEASAQDGIDAFARRLESYKISIRDLSINTIRQLKSSADTLGLDSFIRTLEDAETTLEQGIYPALGALERGLVQAVDARRAEQLSDLRLLEAELKNYQGATDETLSDIKTFIDHARTSLEQGDIVVDFERGWSLLELLRQDTERRSAGFIPRLDAALQDFEAVAKLNSDDVDTLRRILTHLDSQREAFGRVSAGLQTELEASLSRAETMIGELKEQFEATRAIAGQLVNASVLDDLFGAFEGGPFADTPSADTATDEPEPMLTQKKTGLVALDEWVNECRNAPGVRGVLVYRPSGFAGGYIDLDLAPLDAALDSFAQAFVKLGKEINSGTQQLMVLELRNHGVISAWPAPDARVVVITEQPAALEPTIHLLRRDLPQLRDWLNAPSLA